MNGVKRPPRLLVPNDKYCTLTNYLRSILNAMYDFQFFTLFCFKHLVFFRIRLEILQWLKIKDGLSHGFYVVQNCRYSFSTDAIHSTFLMVFDPHFASARLFSHLPLKVRTLLKIFVSKIFTFLRKSQWLSTCAESQSIEFKTEPVSIKETLWLLMWENSPQNLVSVCVRAWWTLIFLFEGFSSV